MDKFKKDLLAVLEKHIKTEDLPEGCPSSFIVDGMVESIGTSLRLASIAQLLPENFKAETRKDQQ